MTDSRNFADIVGIFVNLILAIIPIVAGAALLFFFVGLVRFLFNLSGDAKAVAEGKNMMIYGGLAIFAMVSIWGILRFLSGEFGFGDIRLPLLPPYNVE